MAFSFESLPHSTLYIMAILFIIFLGKERDVEGRAVNLKLGKDLLGHLPYLNLCFFIWKIKIIPNSQGCCED